MAKPPHRRTPRPETLWQAIYALCHVAGYDFQLYKISDPPAPDADPVIIYPEQFKDVVIPDE